MVRVAPYGSWDSPITVEMLTHSQVTIGSPVVDGSDLYWAERRPAEAGRTAIVRRTADGRADVTPEDFNARTRIHEYGGTAYAVAGGVVLASRFEDQRIYRLDGPTPHPITPEPATAAGDRYGDLVFHGDQVIAVRERHDPAAAEPVNELVVFPLDGSAPPRAIASGHDFVSSPRRSRDGSRLAWLTWDHPRMPWDGTELWVADLAADGTLGEPAKVAGGATVSIFQPEWGPGDVLHWVTDESGWWNLVADGRPLAEAEAEFGSPQWVFGMARYGFTTAGEVIAVVTEQGRQRVVRLGEDSPVDVPFPHDTITPYLALTDDTAWMVAGDATTALGLVGLDLTTGEMLEVARNFTPSVEPAFFSLPETITAPTTGGAETHAFYYPPGHPEVVGPDTERPPLLVISHGGPTSATTTDLDLRIQFWTSRGFGVVDVNYRGSTGYGRAYRTALEGEWGIVDTDDCIAVARHLAETGRVDPARLAIRGGSAGGYTTLCALAFHDVFAAGVSYFGVADCTALAEHTHKFESRYLDSLIGPYPAAAERYRERSPLHHAEGISCPVLLLQGEDDEVVPPAQAEVMVEALRTGGIPHAYLLFAGEGHGFRKAETITAAQSAELAFYGRVFGCAPADDLPPFELD